MKCAFTICAKNYIGLAKVLQDSFLEHNPEAEFYIFIADEPDEHTPALESNIVVTKDNLNIEQESWVDQSFKYNLTEFCTAIKPKCFEWLFVNKKADKVIYLDPDIYCYSDFNSIYNNLDNYSMIFSPHITTIETDSYSGDLAENIFLWSGIFNLGFLALRNDTNSTKLISWWNCQLESECFFDNSRFTATDQKWMVYMPMFFDRETLLIDRDMGIDAAPWNFYEREFYVENGETWVRNRIEKNVKPTKLKFVHFSNYKYAELTKGIVNHYSLKHEYEDLDAIFAPYVEKLNKCEMSKYLPLKYSYNTFDNGQIISLLNRRIYRRLTLDGVSFTNPFATTKSSFFDTLKCRKLLTDSAAITTSVRGSNKDAGVGRQVRIFDTLCRIARKIMGIDRYELFIRFAASRLIPENQAHLYDKKSRRNL